jgi:hypothetical protein
MLTSEANLCCDLSATTDFGGGVVRDNPAVNTMVAASTALGRAGVPADIGPMIALLFSEDNRWVHAQPIEAGTAI